MPLGRERMHELAETGFGKRPGDAEFLRFVSGMAACAEQNVHHRREIGIVSRITLLRMMPVMQFRRADDHAQRTERQADVGMNMDRPDAAEGGEPGERGEIESQQKCRQVDQADGVNVVWRMLAVRRQTVEMLRAVMHGVESIASFPTRTSSSVTTGGVAAVEATGTGFVKGFCEACHT